MFLLRFKSLDCCSYLKCEKSIANPFPVCPVSCELLFLWCIWLSCRQNNSSDSSYYKFGLLSFISCLSDYSFFKKKKNKHLILKQTYWLVLLTGAFPDNRNNILDWYFPIPPQYSSENDEICFWFDAEWL